ncbi:MAG TPA: hypothetical protein VGL86_07170 [Polyangia bacterium]
MSVPLRHAPAPRPEYERLARDFPSLAAQFGLTVDAALAGELVDLIGVFEAVDRHVDAIDDAGARVALQRSILAALDGGAPLDGELGARVAVLRRLAARDAGAARRCGAEVERFFARSETLRTTTDARVFVRTVLDEAAPACALTLDVAARLASPEFARFFAVLSEVANLVDKLHDVRGDRRRGEIAVRAGARLHAALFAALVVRGAKLLWLAPKPLALVAWGARHLLPPASHRDRGQA